MKRQAGLTLIEMMVTVSVLLIIFTVAVPTISNQFAKARAQRLEIDIRLLVESASSYALRRWKPTYIHLINIPKDKTTTDATWCLVASPYTSVTKCSDESDTEEDFAREKRVATVWGNRHPDIVVKRLIAEKKIKFRNSGYTLFLGDEQKDEISILEVKAGEQAYAARVVGFMNFEFE